MATITQPIGEVFNMIRSNAGTKPALSNSRDYIVEHKFLLRHTGDRSMPFIG
jgi:hypothetical protein